MNKKYLIKWISGCDIPETFFLEVDNDKKIFVYDAEISFKYDRNELAVQEYPDTKAVNILINNTAVYFSGNVQNIIENFMLQKYEKISHHITFWEC